MVVSDASLQVSPQDMLKIFYEDVISEKMGISIAQCQQCIKILSNMIHSKNLEEYIRHYDELKSSTEAENVVKYVEEFWDNSKAEWVEGLKLHNFLIDDTFDNNLYALNSKIEKVMCSKHSVVLSKLFMDLRHLLSLLRIERCHQMKELYAESRLLSIQEEIVPYADYLTPFAYGHVCQQYKNSLKINCIGQSGDMYYFDSPTGFVSSSRTFCSCPLYSALKIPCQHLIFVRHMLGLNFDNSIVGERWSRSVYSSQCKYDTTESSNRNTKSSETNGTSSATSPVSVCSNSRYQLLSDLDKNASDSSLKILDIEPVSSEERMELNSNLILATDDVCNELEITDSSVTTSVPTMVLTHS